MKDRVLIFVKYVLFAWLILFSATFLFAQTISPQKLPFSQICAGTFNEFSATFKYSGFPATTTFVVELSDNTGSFTNPVNTTILSKVDVSSSEMTIKFAVPATLIGSEIYRLRIKPSTGVASEPFVNNLLKTSFPAYYKSFEGPFYINNQSANVSICNGGSVTLTIDNPTPAIPSSSPANFPNIKYKWFKDGTEIPSASSSSLVVSANGVYYAEIDYGPCTDANSSSNRVTVGVASGAGATLSSSLGNSFCSGGALTTLSTETGNSYVWKKDNAVINGVNTNTYQTNQPGVYTVDVDFGGCKSTATIDLKVVEITSSINVPATSTMKEGETKTVTVTTNANNPSYQWYLDGTAIQNANASTYDVTAEGNYKVIITQTSGCSVSNEIPFVIKYPFVDPSIVAIPNLISPNGDGINDTWIIPQEYASGTNTEVLLMSSLGEIVFKTNDYLNNWPENGVDFKNINPVYYYIITTQDQKVKKGSITVLK